MVMTSLQRNIASLVQQNTQNTQDNRSLKDEKDRAVQDMIIYRDSIIRIAEIALNF